MIENKLYYTLKKQWIMLQELKSSDMIKPGKKMDSRWCPRSHRVKIGIKTTYKMIHG